MLREISEKIQKFCIRAESSHPGIKFFFHVRKNDNFDKIY